MRTVCPGQDTRFWRPGDIFDLVCSQCGNTVEFFKDDVSRNCGRCGRLLRNPKLDLGCARWCRYAADCLGFDPTASGGGQDAGETSFIDRLVGAVRSRLGGTQGGAARIARVVVAMGRARESLRRRAGDPRVVFASLALHELELKVAEARRLLQSLGLAEDVAERACAIVGALRDAGEVRCDEFGIVRDALREG